MKIDASAFYPALEPYYNEGNLPFIRVQDTDMKIDYDNCIKIPETITQNPDFSTLKITNLGDIVITKGGSIARVGFIKKKSAVCRDLIFLNASILPNFEYKFLYIYCLSYIYKDLLIRSSSMTAQPHLTITLVKDIPIYNPKQDFKIFMASLFDKIIKLDGLINSNYKNAEKILLNELGIQNWQPKHELSYVKNFSDVSISNRYDAEYFQPKYDEILEIINKNNHTTLIEQFDIIRNSGLEYDSEGKNGVIKTKQLKECFIDFNVEDRTNQGDSNILVKNQDVLFASMGVGSLGKANTYYDFEDNDKYIIDSTLKIFRAKIGSKISPEYLDVYLHSQLAQELIYQNIVGSSGIISIYESYLQSLPIPIINRKAEEKIIENVHNAHLFNFQSKQLLEIAKRGVEIAIEENEEIATEWINEQILKLGINLN